MSLLAQWLELTAETVLFRAKLRALRQVEHHELALYIAQYFWKL